MAENNSSGNGDKNGKDKKPPRRKPDPNDKFEWLKATRTLTFWILLIIGSWIVFNYLAKYDETEEAKSYTQYRKLLETDQIDGAEIIDREFRGQLKDGTTIVTTLPFIDADMLAEWDSLGIDYQFKEKTTSWVGYIITSILPWIVILAVWLYILRRMQGGGGARGMFSFGKSRAKLMVENKPAVTFKDVAGVEEAKEELEEIIAFLRDPKKFSRLGGRIPKGALLLGPPGTGKTLLARAVAGEAEVPFFSMSGADFVEMFVGVGAARVRDLFEQGKKSAPCIIFIDEIDAVGRHRGAGMGGGHDEREQTLNQLLVEMDGFEGNEGVILIAATNRPDVLDPALTRPGRFDRQIVVDRPDVRGREGILKVHSRNIPLDRDVDLSTLAKGTPGLAGADLANLVNEAALLAARRDAQRVKMSDFEDAKDKVMMGTERKSMVISDTEKKQTAIHEAGHVLVSKLTPGADPVHKVTIIPRGRALGVTHYLPIDEKHSYSRSYLTQTLCHLLGGRAAEKLVFHELSTGAGNDIERATEIARRMICEWGMSEKLGPVRLGNSNNEVFLGRDFHQQRNFSERTAQDIDNEVRRIVTDALNKAEKLLRDNRDKLNTIADALLDREILDGNEIDQLIKGRKLPPPKSRSGAESEDKSQRPQKTRSRRPVRRGGRPPQRDDKQANTADSKQKPDSDGTRQTRPRVTVSDSRSSGSSTRQSGSQTTSGSRTNTGSRTTSGSSPRAKLSREFGVVSSRDPENQRPKASELAKETDSGREDKLDSDRSTGSPRSTTTSSSTRRTPARRTTSSRTTSSRATGSRTTGSRSSSSRTTSTRSTGTSSSTSRSSDPKTDSITSSSRSTGRSTESRNTETQPRAPHKPSSVSNKNPEHKPAQVSRIVEKPVEPLDVDKSKVTTSSFWSALPGPSAPDEKKADKPDKKEPSSIDKKDDKNGD